MVIVLLLAVCGDSSADSSVAGCGNFASVSASGSYAIVDGGGDYIAFALFCDDDAYYN